MTRKYQKILAQTQENEIIISELVQENNDLTLLLDETIVEKEKADSDYSDILQQNTLLNNSLDHMTAQKEYYENRTEILNERLDEQEEDINNLFFENNYLSELYQNATEDIHYLRGEARYKTFFLEHEDAMVLGSYILEPIVDVITPTLAELNAFLASDDTDGFVYLDDAFV